MTPDLEHLEKVCAEATARRWQECASAIETHPQDGPVVTVCVTPSPHARAGTKPGEKWRRDRTFIATFDPPTVASLLADIQRVTAERDGLETALRLVLPLAKGYAPEGQTPTAKRTCREWIEAAEAALSPVLIGGEGEGSACTNLGGEEPDGSFASDGPCQSEGGGS